jgi:MFS family permease
VSDGQLAIAFIVLDAGAVAGLQLGAVVVTRLGSRRVLLVALPAFAGLVLPISYAPNLATLAVAAGLAGAANSVVDVAMNDQGVGVQPRLWPVTAVGHARHAQPGRGSRRRRRRSRRPSSAGRDLPLQHRGRGSRRRGAAGHPGAPATR